MTAIIPFGHDPYDAIGSFGAVLSGESFSPCAQAALVLAVLIPMAGDVVAMARHPSMWRARRGVPELLVLVVGMTLFAIVVLLLVRPSIGTRLQADRRNRRRAVTASLIFLTVLVGHRSCATCD
jgi:hypothetical protein